MKIIHIVENLDKGAVENWLVNIFLESRKTRPEWQWTFYCILGREGRLDQKVIDAGAKIIYAPVSVSSKMGFLKALRKTLLTGRYDIIHSHHDYLSGFYLLASTGIKFRRRILQVHNTDKSLPVGKKLLQRMLLGPFRRLSMHFSDIIVGISNDTLTEYVGKKRIHHPSFRILYYGINMDAFSKSQDFDLRKEVGLTPDSKILLFVGRMNELKNPVFVVEILKELLKVRKDVYAVFIGKGDQENIVAEKAEAYHIKEHIRLAGWYNNIAAIMKNADVFVFPRKEYPKEGLGLVVVEAQAAGLPLFITKGIVPDAIVIEELVFYNDLVDPSAWAAKISAVLDNGVSISRDEALHQMKSSKFELGTATNNLIGLYEG